MRATVTTVRSVLVLCVLFGVAGKAHSHSSETIVTPTNISGLSVKLQVEAGELDSGSISFKVLVSSGYAATRSGELQIDEWFPSESPAKTKVLQARSWKVSCFVRENLEDETLAYSFTIPREWLEEAYFEFANLYVHSAIRYRLRLKTFAPPESG